MNRSSKGIGPTRAVAPAFGQVLIQSEPSEWHIFRDNHSTRRAGSDQVFGWDELSERFKKIVERGRQDRVYFFRHGATKYNQRNLVSGQHDTVLSELGMKQACALRDALPDTIDLIVCSALTRTIQTMVIGVPWDIRRQVTVLADPRLNEVNLGILQGHRRRYLPQFQEGDLDFAPERGESYRTAARRVLSVIADLYDALAACGSAPRTAVVFCHAGVLRIVSTLVLGGAVGNIFRTSHANTECLAVSAMNMRLPDFWKGINNVDGTSECHPVQDQRSQDWLRKRCPSKK